LGNGADASRALQINVIDIDPYRNGAHTEESQPMNTNSDVDEEGASADNLLAVFEEAPVQGAASATSVIVGETTVHSSEITINGVPLFVIHDDRDNNNEFVFDYYWSTKAYGCKASQIEDVRLASADDILLFDGEDTDESRSNGDSDDSNDENNWRNDYPDETEVFFFYYDFKDLTDRSLLVLSSCLPID
uniref:Probable RNA polymerase II nuclear localization protein SLC7A6OS n=1 Tax=Gongylonema pulchrum TaxID=637853 RepID=A0A183EKN6_9BILA